MKHISRIHQPDNNTVGWYFRLIYDGEEYSKFFSDKKYGGKEAALKAALKYRTKMTKWRDKQPTTKVHNYKTRFYYEKGWNNTTGVVGVYRTHKNDRKGNPVYYYSTTVCIEKGKPTTRSFNIAIHGEEEAFLMAVDFRRQGLKKVYGDRFNEQAFQESVDKYLEKLENVTFVG